MAKAGLPNGIGQYTETLTWRVEFESPGLGDLALGDTEPHEIYVKYGPSTCTGGISTFWEEEIVTEKRLRLVTEAAIQALPSKALKEIAVQIAAEINSKRAPGIYQLPDGNKPWSGLDNGKLECESGRVLAVAGLMFLGVPQSKLRWRCEDKCHAYPSTDNDSGIGYLSDCTDREIPSVWTYNPTNCTMVPKCSKHPASGASGTPYHDSDECGHDGQPYPEWHLAIAGNGPAENFFKVNSDDELLDEEKPEEDDVWFYISVTPCQGPFRGSITPGDELDKSGRYRLMKANNFGQVYRGRCTVPAPALPALP